VKARCAWIVAAILVVGTAAHTAEQPPAAGRSSIPVTRLYSGNDGETHAEQTAIGFGPAPRFKLHEQTDLIAANGFVVQRWRAGSVADSHTTPQPQYVFGLSGQGEIEISGKKVRLGAGDVVRAEDATGKGHITRCVGQEDCVTIHVFFQPK